LAQDYKRQDRGKKNKNFDDLDNWKAAKEERESGKLSITHVIITYRKITICSFVPF
jgi:hypothetical protein